MKASVERTSKSSYQPFTTVLFYSYFLTIYTWLACEFFYCCFYFLNVKKKRTHSMVFYRKNVLVLIFMNNTFWNSNLISVIRFSLLAYFCKLSFLVVLRRHPMLVWGQSMSITFPFVSMCSSFVLAFFVLKATSLQTCSPYLYHLIAI